MSLTDSQFQISMQPGCYVVAVSGGVDSMVLLHLLWRAEKYQLVVAHFDHGIRSDSSQDCQFVAAIAEQYGLQFMSQQGNLGSNASEDTARRARYDFLRYAQNQTRAKAIVTAHHQDDLLETAFINLVRGTGRHGLSSLRSTSDIQRPLLSVPKAVIVDYARQHRLTWREDATNSDNRYLRNRIRQSIMPAMTTVQRESMLEIINRMAALNREADGLVCAVLNSMLTDGKLKRQLFNQLPHSIAREIMLAWLQQVSVEIDRKMVERLVVAAKTFAPGMRSAVNRNWWLQIEQQHLALMLIER